MKKPSQQVINDFIENKMQGIESECDVELRTDYSGRGMYGRSCVGFVLDASYQIKVSILLAQAIERMQIEQEEKEWLLEQIMYPAKDNMGYDMIMYYSGLSLVEEETAESE